jgi:hypothetical protein
MGSAGKYWYSTVVQYSSRHCIVWVWMDVGVDVDVDMDNVWIWALVGYGGTWKESLEGRLRYDHPRKRLPVGFKEDAELPNAWYSRRTD